MDTELLGLDAEVGTALALIASGVIVPAVTSLLAYEGIPKWLKRLLPIALSAGAGVVIVILAAGGPFAEQLITWLLVAATVVGISQGVYAAMPGAWKRLETATAPGAKVNNRSSVNGSAFSGPRTHDPVLRDTGDDLGRQSGAQSFEAEEVTQDPQPYRQDKDPRDPRGDYSGGS